MKLYKKFFVYSTIVLITIFSMLIPNTVDYFTDYYRGNKTEEKYYIADINQKETKKTKSEVANLLIDSDLTQGNRVSDVSTEEVKENVMEIFSDIYSDNSKIFGLFNSMISKSEIVYAMPRYSLLIKNGQVHIFEILSVFFDCGINITYETDSLILVTFEMNNNFSYPETTEVLDYIYEEETAVRRYFREELKLDKYNLSVKEYEQSQKSFYYYFGLNFFPENQIIYKPNAEYY